MPRFWLAKPITSSTLVPFSGFFLPSLSLPHAAAIASNAVAAPLSVKRHALRLVAFQTSPATWCNRFDTTFRTSTSDTKKFFVGGGVECGPWTVHYDPASDTERSSTSMANEQRPRPSTQHRRQRDAMAGQDRPWSHQRQDQHHRCQTADDPPAETDIGSMPTAAQDRPRSVRWSSSSPGGCFPLTRTMVGTSRLHAQHTSLIPRRHRRSGINVSHSHVFSEVGGLQNAISARSIVVPWLYTQGRSGGLPELFAHGYVLPACCLQSSMTSHPRQKQAGQRPKCKRKYDNSNLYQPRSTRKYHKSTRYRQSQLLQNHTSTLCHDKPTLSCWTLTSRACRGGTFGRNRQPSSLIAPGTSMTYVSTGGERREEGGGRREERGGRREEGGERSCLLYTSDAADDM
eukprot:2266221-Rhodomonas_salina.2